MLTVIGIDPSTTVTGLAALRDGDLFGLQAVRMFPGNPIDSLRERIVPLLKEWAFDGTVDSQVVICAEKPPPTARASVNHGHQGTIGDAVGYVGGLCLGWAAGRLPGGRISLLRVPSGGPDGWRATMTVEAGRRGVDIQRDAAGRKPGRVFGKRGKPERNPAGPGFVLPYLGCNHRLECAGYTELVQAPAACPRCAGTPDPGELDARDRWKRAACLMVEGLWPGQYGSLVADAASRAKSVQESWRYVGVADACEAACIAMHAAAVLREANVKCGRALDSMIGALDVTEGAP